MSLNRKKGQSGMAAGQKFPEENLTEEKIQFSDKSVMIAQELSTLFEWVDSVELSRPKKNINRDFSDAVMYAELIDTFYPKLVEMHNYPTANSFAQKKDNWEVLNKKVLCKIGLKFSPEHILELAQAKIGGIEAALKQLYEKVNDTLDAKQKEKEEAARGDGSDGDRPDPLTPREVLCVSNGNPENGVTYQGVKMVPASVVENQEKRIKELETTLKDLRKKVRRQETMITLKEERLQDLTFELHEAQVKNEEQGKINKWCDPTGLV